MITYKLTQGLDQNPDAKLIRTAVFQQEQGFTLEFDEIDHCAYHLVVYDEGKPVATGRTFPKPAEPRTYIIGRVAVLKEYRGRNLGTLILEQLEKAAKKLGAKAIELSAQIRVKEFYQKSGYEPIGEEYLDEFCPHITMKRSLL